MQLYGLVASAFIVGMILMVPENALAQRGPKDLPPANPALPTLWLVGDSTVRNGNDQGGNGQWGWGNPIAHYFDTTKVNVVNRAVGGTSSRTFYRDLWPKTRDEIKPGDFVIMNFGHNDGGAVNDDSRARGTIKGNGEETQEIDNMITKQHEVVHTYGWYLRQFYADAKAKGAKEVYMATMTPRNNWKDGKMVRNDGNATAVQAAAKQVDATYLPLNALACEKFDVIGEQKTTDEYYPANDASGKKETLHPAWRGSIVCAEAVIDGLKKLEKSELASFIKPDAPKDLQPPSGKIR